MSTFTIEKKELKTALNAVIGSVGKPGKYSDSLTCINVEVNGNLQFTATSGYMLASYAAPLNISGKCAPDQFLIPPDQFKPLLGLCKGKGIVTFETPTDVVEITVLSDTGETRFERPEQKFPDYSKVIPASFEYGVTFPAADLKAALTIANKQMRVNGVGKIRAAAFQFAPGTCSIKSEYSEAGVTEFTIAVEHSGDGAPIGIDTGFALKMLKAFGKADTVRLEYIDAALSEPCVKKALKFSAPDMPQFYQIVMPFKIKPEFFAPVEVVEPVEVPETVEAVPEPVIALPGPTLVIEGYSEKAVIIYGDTRPHSRRIKSCVPKAHGIWHRKAGGWLFSKKHETALRDALADLLAA